MTQRRLSFLKCIAMIGALGVTFMSQAASDREVVVRSLDAMVVARMSSALRAEMTDLPETRTLEVGAPLEVMLESDVPGFVSLIYVDAHGVIDVFTPRLGDSGNFLKAEMQVFVPEDPTDVWQARMPVGKADVYVIASTDPLASLRSSADLSASRYLVGNADAPALVERLTREVASRDDGTVAVWNVKFDVQVAGGGDYSKDDIVRYFTETTRSIDSPRLDVYINFRFNSSEITSESLQRLNTWGLVLSDPMMSKQRFVIGGHTDDVGNDEFNHDLSIRRAQAIKDILVSRYGISPSRLEIEGYGERRPLVSGTSDTERAANRRVDFERISSL